MIILGPSRREEVASGFRPLLLRSLLFCAGLSALILCVVFVRTVELSAWDFRNNLWGPAHLLVNGQSPYDIAQLFTGSNAVWMPTVIGAAFPLGWLPEPTATSLWAVLNLTAYIALIALTLWLAADGDWLHHRPAPVWLAAALIGTLLFPPFVSLMVLGQVGVMVALLLMLAAVLIRSRLWLSALFLVLAAAKPQLLVLAGPGLVAAAWRDHGWLGAAWLIRWGLLWSALLTLPLWIAHPGWLVDFRAALASNPGWGQPSTLTALRLALGTAPGVIVWSGVSLLVMVFVLRGWLQGGGAAQEDAVTMLWSLALTPLVTPYVWTWDFVLMVPALVWTLFRVPARSGRWLLVGGYVVAWLLTVYIRVTTDNSDLRFWWLSWLLVALIAASWLLARWLERQRAA